jgi:hypothetical protein
MISLQLGQRPSVLDKFSCPRFQKRAERKVSHRGDHLVEIVLGSTGLTHAQLDVALRVIHGVGLCEHGQRLH